MAIEIAKQAFDDDFALQPLAEERDVRPHDGAQVHQDRGLARGQASKKLSKRLRRKNLTIVRERGGRGRHVVPTFAGIPEQGTRPLLADPAAPDQAAIACERPAERAVVVWRQPPGRPAWLDSVT